MNELQTPAARPPPRTILIVEDDPAHAEAIVRALEAGADSCRILRATTLRESREIITRETPSLVLADLNLADGKAFELLADAQPEPAFPILVMTSHGDEQMAVQALKSGALDYVVKSAETFAEMPRIVARAFREWQNRIERRRAEKALEESEARYRKLFEDTPYLAVQGYRADGTVEYWNKASEIVYGYAAAEAVGKNLLDLIVPEELRPAMAGSLAKMARSGEPTPAAERLLARKDGSRVLVYASYTVVHVPGQATQLFCLGIDLSERKRLESQLRQAQKMEAVGQLAGGVAHDFNNLLQAILGYGTLLDAELPPEDERRAHLAEMLKAAERAAGLTRQLLAFGRRQILDPKPLDVNEVAGDLIKMIRRLIGEHIELVFLPGPALGAVHADRGQLEQVLMNLCVNSRDAMPQGGRLAIETRRVELDPAFCAVHDWAKPGAFVCLTVTDTGCGMDANTLGHIFEPFFTTKESGKGTGLGLATVYGIIQQHEGLIHVNSAEHRGTTFAAYLPAHDAGKPVVAADKVSPLARGGSETLLVAEDEPLVRSLARQVLERAGYTVIEAVDGQDLLEVFRKHGAQADLVFTDIVMPRLGGMAACAHIRKERPSMPCLLTTGYSEAALHHGLPLEAGFSFIQKPYLPDELLRGVRRALDARDGER